jgi:hypothetical protein
MSRPLPLPYGLNSSPGRTGHDAGGRMINAYPEKMDDQAKTVWQIVAMEGAASFATLSGGGVYRGGILVGNYRYIVSGTTVWKVDSGGGATNIGTFPGSEPVFMSQNRAGQVAIVSGGLRYTIIADVVATIADGDLPASSSVTTVDGYGIFTASSLTGRFFITSIDDYTAIDALDFATAESNPDTLLVAYGRGSDVLFFGTKSVEFWRNTGNASFPFERIPGTALQNMGLMCKHTVADIADIVFFVASDGTVRMLSGYTPIRISNHDQERAIGDVSDKDSIRATVYSFRGHQFYILSCATWSWAYDATNGFWHERQSYGETRWRIEGATDLEGQIVVGDFENGVLYEMSATTYTEASTHLVWIVRTPPVHGYPNRLSVNRLFLDTIPGVGLNSGDDHEDDPQVMVRTSKDGGKTFSNYRTADVGQIGEFNKRVKMDRFGMTHEDGMIFEISMSAAVIRGLTGGAVDADLLEP